MKYPVLLAFCALANPVLADPPEITGVKAVNASNGWRFDVTVLHPDSGWDHYADGWRVLDMNGVEIGLRVLLHPHETEQPFTRSLSGVDVPAGTRQVQIEARCSVDGWTGTPMIVTLP